MSAEPRQRRIPSSEAVSALRAHRARCALIALDRVPDADGHVAWLKNGLRFELRQATTKAPNKKIISELSDDLDTYAIEQHLGAAFVESLHILHFAIAELLGVRP